MGWKYCRYKVKGIRVIGDPSVPPTRWWNHLYLRLFVWKQVSIFRVPEGSRLYVVGYRPQNGLALMTTDYYGDSLFAVRSGREDCTFFAIGSDGAELKLTLVKQTTILQMDGSIPLI